MKRIVCVLACLLLVSPVFANAKKLEKDLRVEAKELLSNKKELNKQVREIDVRLLEISGALKALRDLKEAPEEKKDENSG